MGTETAHRRRRRLRPTSWKDKKKPRNNQEKE
jgi:hypothetical protein